MAKIWKDFDFFFFIFTNRFISYPSFCQPQLEPYSTTLPPYPLIYPSPAPTQQMYLSLFSISNIYDHHHHHHHYWHHHHHHHYDRLPACTRCFFLFHSCVLQSGWISVPTVTVTGARLWWELRISLLHPSSTCYTVAIPETWCNSESLFFSLFLLFFSLPFTFIFVSLFTFSSISLVLSFLLPLLLSSYFLSLTLTHNNFE